MRILILSSINKNSIPTLDNYLPNCRKLNESYASAPNAQEEMDAFAAFLGKPKNYNLVCQVQRQVLDLCPAWKGVGAAPGREAGGSLQVGKHMINVIYQVPITT